MSSGSGMIGGRVYELPPIAIWITEVMAVGSLQSLHARIVETIQVRSHVLAIENEIDRVRVLVDRLRPTTAQLQFETAQLHP